LPQPGPIEPAPTTIAVLPLSRSIAFSRSVLSCFVNAHGDHVSTDRIAENSPPRPNFFALATTNLPA
jgi:hypothetical protein